MSVSKDEMEKDHSESEDEMEAGPSFCNFDQQELKKIVVKVIGKGSKRKENKPFDVSEVKPVRRKDYFNKDGFIFRYENITMENRRHRPKLDREEEEEEEDEEKCYFSLKDEGLRPIFDRPEIKEFRRKKLLEKKEKADTKAGSEDLKNSQEKNQDKNLTRTIKNDRKSPLEDPKNKKKRSSPEMRRRDGSGRSRDRREHKSPLKKGARSYERRDGRERHPDEDDRSIKCSEERDSRTYSGRRHSPERSTDKRMSRYHRSRSREKRNRSDSSQDSSEDDKSKLPKKDCDETEFTVESSAHYPNPGMLRGSWGQIGPMPFPRRPPYPPYHYPAYMRPPIIYHPPIPFHPPPRRMPRGYFPR